MFDPQGLYSRRTYDSRKGQVIQKKGSKANKEIDLNSIPAIIEFLRNNGYYISEHIFKPLNLVYHISNKISTRHIFQTFIPSEWIDVYLNNDTNVWDIAGTNYFNEIEGYLSQKGAEINSGSYEIRLYNIGFTLYSTAPTITSPITMELRVQTQRMANRVTDEFILEDSPGIVSANSVITELINRSWDFQYFSTSGTHYTSLSMSNYLGIQQYSNLDIIMLFLNQGRVPYMNLGTISFKFGDTTDSSCELIIEADYELDIVLDLTFPSE